MTTFENIHMQDVREDSTKDLWNTYNVSDIVLSCGLWSLYSGRQRQTNKSRMLDGKVQCEER